MRTRKSDKALQLRLMLPINRFIVTDCGLDGPRNERMAQRVKEARNRSSTVKRSNGRSWREVWSCGDDGRTRRRSRLRVETARSGCNHRRPTQITDKRLATFTPGRVGRDRRNNIARVVFNGVTAPGELMPAVPDACDAMGLVREAR